MKRLLKTLVLGVLLGVLLLPSYGGRPRPVVELKATFRNLADPDAPLNTYEYYADKICGDDFGEYVSKARDNISVLIYADKGELFFKIEHNSGRSAKIIFPRESGACGALPDTVGIYPELPLEPVDFLRFKTYNSDAYAGPRVNFLTMQPGEATQVRLWITMCTIARHFFVLKYDPLQAGTNGGVVMVKAIDIHDDPTTEGYDGDNKVERWELYPLPTSNDQAIVQIEPHGEGKDKGRCTFGTYQMPFKLILDRVE